MSKAREFRKKIKSGNGHKGVGGGVYIEGVFKPAYYVRFGSLDSPEKKTKQTESS